MRACSSSGWASSLSARGGAPRGAALGKPGSSIGASVAVLEEIAAVARVALTASAD
jgi:hypothetical protein